jgi:hypothetical protein
MTHFATPKRSLRRRFARWLCQLLPHRWGYNSAQDWRTCYHCGREQRLHPADWKTDYIGNWRDS